MEAKPVLGIIIVSTRPDRAGGPIAQWFESVARQHSAFDLKILDLCEIDLPMVNEPEHPRLGRYQHDYTKRWSAMVKSCDAFVAITPEYNFGAPPSIVNAFDYVYAEWNYKPFGFVSYGGVSGGTRAVQMIKLIVTGLKMMPMVETVAIPFVAKLVHEGRFDEPEGLDAAARTMLAEMVRWEEALRPLRAPRV